MNLQHLQRIYKCFTLGNNFFVSKFSLNVLKETLAQSAPCELKRFADV